MEELGGYLDDVRRAVRGQNRWSVTDDAYLSAFSFLKLSMYKDLEGGSTVAEANAIVAALAGDPSSLFDRQGDAEVVPPDELDQVVDPVESFQVVDADSSQQQAIELAKSGVSFILQGPPGTGKSQTITNIIAEVLGQGRTVLFVSEKAAALDVVYRRLRQVGLADFCLPLHSHKANKREIVAELARVYSKGPSSVGSQRQFLSAEQLKEYRRQLNGYVRALHEVQEPLGRSVFSVQAELLGLAEAPDVPFEIPGLATTTELDLRHMQGAVARVAGCSDAVRGYHENPWTGCILDGQQAETRRQLKAEVEEAARLLSSCVAKARSFAEYLGLSVSCTPENLLRLVGFARHLAEGPMMRADWIDAAERTRCRQQLDQLAQQLDALATERQGLGEFKPALLSYDLDGLQVRLETSYSSAVHRLGSAYRTELRALAELTVAGAKPKYDQLVSIVPVAISARNRLRWLSEAGPALQHALGRSISEETDVASVRFAIDWTDQLAGSFGSEPPSGFADTVGAVPLRSTWPQDARG